MKKKHRGRENGQAMCYVT